MSSQSDWIGSEPVADRARRQMRDTRDSVADQKAHLSLRLHKLCQYCPDAVRNGDVFRTREWVSRQAAAKKTAAKVRSSANELQMAVTSLEGYLNPMEVERFAR